MGDHLGRGVIGESEIETEVVGGSRGEWVTGDRWDVRFPLGFAGSKQFLACNFLSQSHLLYVSR